MCGESTAGKGEELTSIRTRDTGFANNDNWFGLLSGSECCFASQETVDLVVTDHGVILFSNT